MLGAVSSRPEVCSHRVRVSSQAGSDARRGSGRASNPQDVRVMAAPATRPPAAQDGHLRSRCWRRHRSSTRGNSPRTWQVPTSCRALVLVSALAVGAAAQDLHHSFLSPTRVGSWFQPNRAQTASHSAGVPSPVTGEASQDLDGSRRCCATGPGATGSRVVDPLGERGCAGEVKRAELEGSWRTEIERAETVPHGRRCRRAFYSDGLGERLNRRRRSISAVAGWHGRCKHATGGRRPDGGGSIPDRRALRAMVIATDETPSRLAGDCRAGHRLM